MIIVYLTVYINNQTPEVQEQFGFGPLSKTKRELDLKKHVASCEHCFSCGNTHKDFRDENENDKIPMGCTLQGIIVD